MSLHPETTVCLFCHKAPPPNALNCGCDNHSAIDRLVAHQQSVKMLSRMNSRVLLGSALRASSASSAAMRRSPLLNALPLARSNGLASSQQTQMPAWMNGLQLHAFSTSSSQEQESDKKRIEELLKQNAALQQEIVKLKEEVSKKPGKFMSVMSQYGLPFVVWWTTAWAASGVGLYFAFDSGLIASKDVIEFVLSMGLDKFIDIERINPTYGNIALAVIVNECIEPLRFPIVLATLPTVKRIFSRKKPADAAN